jgi:hypothetical protein
MASKQGKKRPHRGSLAILERNLERYPWARLSDDKGEQMELRVLLDSAGEDGRAWIVTGADRTRLPGPFDADLYVALCQLYNSLGRPEHRTVRVSFRELADLMGRGRGSNVYAAIAGGLHRLAKVSIEAVETWREGETIAALKTLHLLTAETRYRRDGEEGGTLAVVRFSEDVAESIAAGNFRLLNAAEYFALELPTAKRLYRYLDYRRWRGSERLAEFTLPLKQLAQELPIDRDAPSHIKRTLDPAHELLIVFASPTPEVPECAPASAERQGDGEYVRDMVAEILGTLRDEHSVGFYVQVAKAFPEDVLRNVLGGVRQSIREGLPIDAARKTFTSAVRTRARAIGVTLPTAGKGPKQTAGLSALSDLLTTTRDE